MSERDRFGPTRRGPVDDVIIGSRPVKRYYSLYNFYWATTTIKGRLLSSRPMLKPFSGEKNSVRNGAQKWRFGGKWGPKP